MEAISASHSRAADFDERVEHLLQIKRRTTDNLKHISGGSLLLEGLSQLVEQPCILDGDDRLSCEVFDQFNLLIGEWPHFLAINDD